MYSSWKRIETKKEIRYEVSVEYSRCRASRKRLKSAGGGGELNERAQV